MGRNIEESRKSKNKRPEESRDLWGKNIEVRVSRNSKNKGPAK